MRRDPRTGKDIILWRDILSAFENAEVILNGRTMVLSLEDDQFVELEPSRIEHHPGVELGVVVRNRDQASSNAEGSSKSRRPRDRNNTFIPTPTPFTPSDTNPQSRTNANNASTISHPSTASSGQLRQDTESLLLTCKEILGVCLEYVKFGKQAPSSDVNQFMEQQKEMFQEANDKNEDLQRRLVACIQEHQQDTKEGMEKMQQMQREALDTLANIHSRIQTVLTQTYELHEYPIPRLFIVLPKTDERLRDKITGFIAEHYKLYLCECGSHTTPKGSKTQHEIHLAKHEGYDLDKPTEFFQRYGSYLITMLQMIQYGIIAAGSIVQPMTNHKVVDDLMAVLKSFRKDVNPLIDSTIKQLQDTQGCKMADARSGTGQADFNQQEALEGTDLRQLMRFLKIKDDGHDLGNLYRIVTEEGHVKWVCIDHYRENYGETLRSRLEDAVKLNGGTFNEATGRIKVSLQSVLQAKEFYDALVKARGTLELDITLKWDSTMDEIQALVDAVDKANVVGLTVDGTFFKRAWDFINRKQRFNPFMALASNDRIQYLKLRGFEAFFHRVSQLPSKPYSKLREFSVESGNLLSPRAIKSFEDFMGHRPPLTTLRLTLSEEHSPVKTAEKIINELERLRLLTIDYGELSVTTRISKRAIQDAELTIRQPADLHSRELDFVIPDNLTRLVITSIPQEVEDSQLVDILCKYPRLGYLQIGCPGWRAPAAIHLIITTRTSILREGGSSKLRTFELMAEKLVPFDVYDKCNDTTHIQTHVSFAENSRSYEMRTWIRLQNRMHIRDDNPVYDVIHRYGWSVVFLEEDWTYNDTFEAILDHIPIPEKRTLQLETLCFELSKFTYSVTRRSPDLKLGLRFELVSPS